MKENIGDSRPSPAEHLAMYERMLLIRRVEERLGADFKAGKLIAGVHLYSGQEAVGVGVCQHLRDTDWIASNHRGHGHFLAKGGDVRAMMAEIHAKVTGIYSSSSLCKNPTIKPWIFKT